MTFNALALVALAGVFGVVLALPERWHLPVILGELVAGIALGTTGVRVLHAADPTFTFLADIGFGLVMFWPDRTCPFWIPSYAKESASV